MAIWVFYFLFKIILTYKGSLRADLAWNLAFTAFLFIPLPLKLRAHAAARWARGTANVTLALLLLWHDSWLPPIADAAAMVEQQGVPEKEYLLYFALRYFDAGMLVMAAALLAACYLGEYLVKRRASKTG